MNDQRKEAYRYLLYIAMLEIRNYGSSRGKISRNPLVWHRRYVQSAVAGAIADWLHNLAAFSMQDFAHFDEDWFWKEGASLKNRFPQLHFREVFDDYLKGKKTVCASWSE